MTKSINEMMEEIHADGLPVSTEIEGPNPEDMEWNVTFENFHRVDTETQEDGKIIVGQEYYVDFSCPGCGHRHEKINFIGWDALICQGCKATLNREESASSSWGFDMLRNINNFWSLCLSWLAVNRPCLKISGRAAAREYCHKFGACLEDFSFSYELTETNIDRYLSRKLSQ